MSLLHLYLTSTDGRVNLDRAITSNKMKLVKYCIQWTNQTASATGGELLNVKIFSDGVLDAIVTSNRNVNRNYLPLANNTTLASTIETLDMVFDTLNDIRPSFDYNIRTKSGGVPANFTSLQMWFEFF